QTGADLHITTRSGFGAERAHECAVVLLAELLNALRRRAFLHMQAEAVGLVAGAGLRWIRWKACQDRVHHVETFGAVDAGPQRSHLLRTSLLESGEDVLAATKQFGRGRGPLAAIPRTQVGNQQVQ